MNQLDCHFVNEKKYRGIKKERKILEKYSKLFFNHYKIQIPSSALSRSHLDLFKGYGRDVKVYICHDLNTQQLYKAYYLILYR